MSKPEKEDEGDKTSHSKRAITKTRKTNEINYPLDYFKSSIATTILNKQPSKTPKIL